MSEAVVKKRIGNDLTEGSILGKLIPFAIPIVLTSLVQQFYSMVDLAVVGRFVGSTGSVGVSTGGEIADMMTPVAMALATAGQVYIAQLVGAKKQELVKDAVGTLMSLSMLMSVIFAVICIALSGPILRALNCPEEAMGQALNYMIVTSLGFPFIFGYNAVVGILRGMGESKKPLMFILIAAAVNIFADILLVAVIPLEALGTAIATVLSQCGSFLAAFIFLYKNGDKFDFKFEPSSFRMKPDIVLILLKLSIPRLVSSICVRFSMMWVNSNVNSYGLVVSATNSIGNKIYKFLDVFIIGVDTACGAMVGQNLGAKKYARAKKTVLTTLGITMLIAVICCVVSFAFPTQIFAVMTKDAAVQQMGREYFRILCFGYFMAAFHATFYSMITGAGEVKLGFCIGILDGVVSRVGVTLFILYAFDLGYSAFWWGGSLARFIPGVVCLVYFLSNRWKTHKLIAEK